ncbi:MAG: hypothetical protein ACI4NJ_11095 [Cellvibrio sp.]
MNRITPTLTTSKRFLIAGAHSGKKVVSYDPQIEAAFKKLKSMALDGNYWAMLTAKGIESLTAGRMFQDNIFIHQHFTNPNARGEFFMILPGFKARFLNTPIDETELVSLTIDTNYEELQEDFKNPALFVAKKSDERNYELKLVTDPASISVKSSLAVISDTANRNGKEFFNKCEKLIGKTGFEHKSIIENEHFLLHFTPKAKGIDGLKSTKDIFTQRSSKLMNESVSLLANTMHAKKDVDGMRWLSVLGGSAITHRTLELLHARNVQLKTHSLYLANPTSNAKLTIDLTKKLGMRGAAVNSGYSLRELKGNHLPGLLNKTNYPKLVGGTIGVASAAGTAVSLSPAATALVGAAIGTASVGTALTVVAAVGLTYTVGAGVRKAYYQTTGR